MKYSVPRILIACTAAAILLTGCNQTTTSTRTSQPAKSQAKFATAQPVATPVASRPTSKPAIPAVVKTAAPVTSYSRYTPQTQLSKYLRSIGSDSMDNVIADWEAALGKYHPKLRFRHEGKGSSTAIPALLEGRSDIGPMSRAVKPAEAEQFKKAFGYAPTELAVAIDTLAVYIHPSNPLSQSGLSKGQLQRIFAESDQPITRWGQLGLSGEWTNAPIRIHGRNPASGTYAFFKSKALSKQDYNERVKEHSGSSQVVNAVEKDPYAIGYSGIAYSTPNVATAPLQDKRGRYVAANQANATSGIYPLTRALYITLNLDPRSEPSALQKEFVRFAYSAEGQAIVNKVGYFPVPVSMARQALSRF